MNFKNILLGLLLMAFLPLMAERVDPETARQVASTFLNNNGVKSAQLTDLSKAAGFSNLYIFNAAQGFVVMAADDCVQPILGYSLTGRFVAENMPTNVSGWLQGYNDEIQFAIDNQMKASTEAAQLWTDLKNGDSKAGRATIVVDALIQSTWDQDPGYNDLCPYDSNAGELTVTGCVATAMAQIMRFWEFPSHGTSSHSYTPSTHSEYGTQSVNYANATYDWAAMPLHSNSAEVAKLMYHCGVAVNMDYDVAANGGSGAYSSDIPTALKNYFYYKNSVSYKTKSSYSSTNWNNLIKTELNAGRPVEYNGSGSGGGHAFVCDGYDNSNYFHFNWGWSGANDGFYSLSNLTPGSGGSGGGSYSFTNSQTAVIGIQPRDCATSTPSNFSVTKEGRNALLTWSAVSNAVSYSVYRNGVLIATTTSTNYTDSNLAYGSYGYYVKSRDSYGAASNPTETITVAIEPVPTNLAVTRINNGAKLTWTAPEWAMPQNDNEVLTYGDGSLTYSFGAGGGSNVYFGHRYPAAMINTNKVLYKVSFYATEIGSFKLYVYTATAGNDKPQTQLYTQSYTAEGTGWNDIILSTPKQLTATKDLWVFIYDPEGKEYPMGIGVFTDSDDGSYITTSSPTSSVSTQSGYVMLIRTCITDGTYSYNLYDNNTVIAQNLTGTSRNLTTITDNTAHQYTLKTNFNGGETDASNMAGLTVGTATIESLELAENDKMTVFDNSKLTVSGILSNNVAANLILNDGAQLVNSSNNVAATVKRAITAYTDDGGWYTISTPFVSYDPANEIATDSYDLYAYKEDGNSDDKEWINYKADNFNLVAGSGYLYAHNPSVTLSMSGILNNGDYRKDVTLSYDNNGYSLKGYNLLGNPTPHTISFTKTDEVSDGYYYLDNSGSWIYNTDNNVPAGRGFLVKANGKAQSVSINPATKRGENTPVVAFIKIDVDGEQAYVKMTEGVSMPLLEFKGQHSNIYLIRDGKPYIMLVNDDAQGIDVCYQPKQAGQHLFNVTLENTELDYLHLIDHLTGADVDLLQNPSYRFESNTNDYDTRFQLLFATNKDNLDNDDNFASISNGQLIINGEGTLQIFDALGHQLLSKHLSTLTSNLSPLTSPGVYVLRLITENEIKTQKIIIK